MKAQIIETPSTIDKKLDAIMSIVGDTNKRLTNLEADMQEVKIRLDTVEERLSNLDSRIDNINLSLSDRIDKINLSLSDRIERLGQGLNKRIDTFYIVLISTLLAWGGMLIAILKLWK